MRVALGQLDANGDCLYATTLARQIKVDYPGCQLAWWVSSRCAHLLEANEFVDEIVVLPVADWANENREAGWARLKSELLRIQSGPRPYDRIWIPQVFPENFRRFDGTVRPSMFRGYDKPITVPIDPVINLVQRERDRAAAFAERHRLAERRHVVLFECSSNSGQSHVTPRFAIDVARRLISRVDDSVVLLSTMMPLGQTPPGVVSAGELSMRENLAILDWCSCFVGCGSGLTVIATCEQAKKMPNVQLLAGSRSVLASFAHDFTYWGKPVDQFVEMADATVERAAACIERCLLEGVEAARQHFLAPVPVTFEFLFSTVDTMLIQRGMFLDAAESLAHAARRYPDHPEIPAFAHARVMPLCRHDGRHGLPEAAIQEAFIHEVLG